MELIPVIALGTVLFLMCALLGFLVHGIFTAKGLQIKIILFVMIVAFSVYTYCIILFLTAEIEKL